MGLTSNMDSSIAVDGAGHASLHRTTRDVLGYTQTLYPLLIVVVFAISFVANSVFSARKIATITSNSIVGTGPGGRPLPKRMRSAAVVTTDVISDFSPRTKAAFKWLSAGVLLTFVADAALNIIRVIIYRRDHWWSGQSAVVITMSSSRVEIWHRKSQELTYCCRSIQLAPFLSILPS